VVPCGHVFYVQRVSELMVKESYNAIREFQNLEEVFQSYERRYLPL
jgi:hypothetical protein